MIGDRPYTVQATIIFQSAIAAFDGVNNLMGIHDEILAEILWCSFTQKHMHQSQPAAHSTKPLPCVTRPL